MNYRHAYHAGNFCDVLKHAVLALVIAHLNRKSSAYRVVDTHAGAGSYDLSGVEALKTREADDGIARVLGQTFVPDIAELLEDYLGVVRALNDGCANVRTYPGSPQLAHLLSREQDVVVANELHGEDRAQLNALFKSARRVKVLGLDGWIGVKSLLPPKERRGVVLIDPPFEEPDEFKRLVGAVRDGLKRFSNGIFLLWYPIKELSRCEEFRGLITDVGAGSVLDATLLVRRPVDESVLNGSGLVVLNPPYELDVKLARLVPALSDVLAQRPGARGDVRWLIRPD